MCSQSMTTLEKLALLVDNIPADRQADFQNALAKTMKQFTDNIELSPEQEAEISRRLADPNPRYATQAEMTALFGKPFPV